ncbi:MAG: type I 3-dehydroquinate dehydratase [Bacteroidales bacterium]|nr:type I 3-dehydroquinate dehydratase [Bacteroidales bacterium]MCL2738738.1 type I 3-dehydroquinate dehydratase [Bacteroidales bacterium]
MKICVCLGADWENHVPVYLQKADLVELRIDLMFAWRTTEVALPDVLRPLLDGNNRKIVLTCRMGTISQEMRYNLFLALLPLSPAYIDLEYDTPQTEWEVFMELAQKHRTKIIASFHHDGETPAYEELRAVAEQSLFRGADLVKIVCRCRDAAEEARLMALYKIPSCAGRLTAFSMGPYGLSSRLHAAALGAPLLYAAPDEGAPTAPGQPSLSQLQAHLLNVL